MAFGANKGTWLFGANSIVANNQATLSTGSAVVAKGDLIVVVIGEQTGNTSSGASDTLGNTYTAATIGTLGGGVSGRAFYTIVTNAGTNTNINVAATASGDNVAIVAASFEGSFSAVDKTPANNNNTDNASPFTCPATGTLAKALEIVIAWMVDNTTNVKTATSPNIKDNQQSQVVISTVLGHKVVTSTATSSPEFTGTNPTGSQQGTLTFSAADLPIGLNYGYPLAAPVAYSSNLATYIETLLPLPLGDVVQAPFNQEDWPLSLGPSYPVQTWLQSPALPAPEPPPPPDTATVRAPHFSPPRKPDAFPYDIPPNILATTLGFRFPFAQYNWPLSQVAYYHMGLRAWAGAIPPPPILAAALPVGQSTLDLPSRSYEFSIQFRTWVTQFRPTVAVALPFNQYDWLVPRGYEFNVSLRSWNISPRPVEVVVVVDTSVPRAPVFTRPREPAPILSTQPLRPLTLFAAPVQVVPFNQNYWPLTAAHRQSAFSWTASYNLNLIGQDKLPTGKIITDRPTLAAIRVTDLGTWISQTKLLLAVPFGQSDWPLPRGPLLPQRSWVWSYNLNLIGKDALPVGDIISDLPPQPPLSANQLRSWINNAALALITVPPAKPFAQYDWPLNFGPLQPVTIFTATYNKNLIGKDIVPGKIVSDLPPRPPQQPAQSFTGKYNENLIGKDRLPTGAEITDLPPQPALSAIQLRTWIQSVNLALVVQAAVLPNNQSDWPITLPPRPQARTFIGFYNLNLIGKDQLPVGEIVTDLPAQQRLAAFTWISAVNLALTTTVARPFNQTDWPLPSVQRPIARTFTGSYIVELIGQDRLPFRQQDWPIWRDHRRGPPSFTAFYNRNLIGKDRLPFRQQDWPLPRDPRRLSDWINLTNPNLFIPGPAPPPPRSPSHRDVSLAIEAARVGEGEQIRPDTQQPQRPAAPRSTRSNIQDPRTRR